MGISARVKADQIERDLGILHPLTRLAIGLRRRDNPATEPYHPVTPYHETVGSERISELEDKGYERADAFIILLMRGGRIESLAAAAGEEVNELAAQVRHRLASVNDADVDPLITEAQRVLDLWRRA